MPDDERVKIICSVHECKHNLMHTIQKANCNLKYIEIGIEIFEDYQYGIRGACKAMEVKRENQSL